MRYEGKNFWFPLSKIKGHPFWFFGDGERAEIIAETRGVRNFQAKISGYEGGNKPGELIQAVDLPKKERAVKIEDGFFDVEGEGWSVSAPNLTYHHMYPVSWWLEEGSREAIELSDHDLEMARILCPESPDLLFMDHDKAFGLRMMGVGRNVHWLSYTNSPPGEHPYCAALPRDTKKLLSAIADADLVSYTPAEFRLIWNSEGWECAESFRAHEGLRPPSPPDQGEPKGSCFIRDWKKMVSSIAPISRVQDDIVRKRQTSITLKEGKLLAEATNSTGCFYKAEIETEREEGEATMKFNFRYLPKNVEDNEAEILLNDRSIQIVTPSMTTMIAMVQ